MSSPTPSPAPASGPTRVASVDAYRGFVMFLMMAEVLRLSRVARALPESGFWKFLSWHQSHVEWVGCSLHDLIQPSFSFLVGVALSGAVKHRARELVSPLRDLFAAVFFVFFSFGVDPTDLRQAVVPVIVLTALSVPGKVVVGRVVTGHFGAGAVLIARGEFSIICAALGASLVDGPKLAAIAAGYVLVTATIGPVAATQQWRRASRRASEEQAATEAPSAAPRTQ